MRCTACGFIMDDNLNFCTNCGASLRSGGSGPQYGQNQDNYGHNSYGQNDYDSDYRGRDDYGRNDYDSRRGPDDYRQNPYETRNEQRRPYQHLFTGTESELASLIINKKNEGIALLLSMLLPGMGHIYLGLEKGFLLAIAYVGCLIASVVLSFIFPLYMIFIAPGLGLVALVIWIYAAVNAFRNAKEYNYLLLQNNGEPPW